MAERLVMKKLFRGSRSSANIFVFLPPHFAVVAELVDALDLGSSSERSRGSIPLIRTG